MRRGTNTAPGAKPNPYCVSFSSLPAPPRMRAQGERLFLCLSVPGNRFWRPFSHLCGRYLGKFFTQSIWKDANGGYWGNHVEKYRRAGRTFDHGLFGVVFGG